MGAIFGKKPVEKPKPAVSEKDKAILELKRQRDRLTKYKTKLSVVIARETEVARALLKNGQKKRALLALKKKKYQESIIEKTEGQMFNIEEMINSIEFAAVQAKVFDALKIGNTVLQQMNDEMKIEDVEKLMDDSAEAVAYQNQVAEMLGANLSVEDESAIEKEYEQLESLVVAEDVKALPAVPVAEPKPVSTEEPEEEPVEVEENEEQAATTKRKPQPVVLLSS